MQKITNDLLVLAEDRACAGRIDQHDARPAQAGMRPFPHAIIAQHRPPRNGFGVANQLDHLGRRGDARRQQIVLQQGVDDGGLARVELANHNDHEEHGA